MKYNIPVYIQKLSLSHKRTPKGYHYKTAMIKYVPLKIQKTLLLSTQSTEKNGIILLIFPTKGI